MLFNALRQHLAGEPHDAQRQIINARVRGPIVQRHPDLERALGAQLVELERAQQADHPMRYPLGRLWPAMVDRDFRDGGDIETTPGAG